MNNCYFCGPTAEIITEEHIWPQWVSRLLFGKYGTNHFVNIRSDANTTTAYRRSNLIDHTSTTVCLPCNTRWLSDLENTQVLPIASEMISGDKQVAVKPFDQSILAAWAYKLSVLLEVPDNVPPKPFSTAAERLRFRQTTLAHPLCKVFVARYNFGQHLGHSLSAIHTLTESQPPKNSYDLAVTTITAGHLAMQVIAVRSGQTGLLVPSSEVNLRSGVDVERDVNQIWPAETRPLQWPPIQLMENEDLEKWTTDWEKPWG